MARKRKRKKQGATTQRGWYEGKIKGVPGGFIKHTNPHRKKLSSLV